VQLVHDDVTRVLRANARSFDAIMLDTDNGRDGMIMQDNARLYATGGVLATLEALRPGGRIVYWSVAEDRGFVGVLQQMGLTVESQTVRAHATSGPYHTLYTAIPGAKRSRF
jgi:spermidine synthase